MAGFEAQGIGAYPHNLELEIWCEGGGTGVLILALSLVAVAAGIGVRRAGIDATSVGVFVLFLVAAQLSGDLFDSRGVFVMAPMVLADARLRLRVRQVRG